MNARQMVVVMLFAAGLITGALAQTPVVTSIQGNGNVTWTNAVNTNAIYRVEWAATAGGPWCQSLQSVHTIDALGDQSFGAAVPMFYRVVMTTNQPPVGMVWIDGGGVELGQNNIAVPVHTNFVSGFWMDEMLVTKMEWDQVYLWAITNGYTFDNAGSGKGTNHPVQSVNFYDCLKWCNARSQKEGSTPCYYIDPIYFNLYKAGDLAISNEWVNWNSGGYRLPTEAEWEKAARGGRRGHLFPWGGDTISHSQANYFSTNTYSYDVSPTRGHHPIYNDGVQPYTSPVGSFPANGFGLHDMAGNVFQWCWDWYGAYSAAYQTDPRGLASGTNRVQHGASWEFAGGAFWARCAARNVNVQGNGSPYVGFRCVRGP